jgi:hypothetical protein
MRKIKTAHWAQGSRRPCRIHHRGTGNQQQQGRQQMEAEGPYTLRQEIRAALDELVRDGLIEVVGMRNGQLVYKPTGKQPPGTWTDPCPPNARKRRPKPIV